MKGMILKSNFMSPTWKNLPESDEDCEEGDVTLGVVRCALTQAKEDNDWRRNAIFYMYIKCGEKDCKVIIDSGCCINAVSSSTVSRLGLKPVPHPTDSRRRHSEFQIGDHVMVRIRPERYPSGHFDIPTDSFSESIHEPTIDHPTTSDITPAPLPISPAPKEHIDAILDEQIISTRDGGVQRFLVRWSGRPASDDTWITSDDLHCHLALGEVEDALHYFCKCLESGGGICLDRRIIIEAADGLQNAQKVANCMDQCAELLRQRTYDAAISALEIISTALSLSSYSETLLEMKGEVLLMLQRYAEVIQLCEQTLESAEKNFAVAACDNKLLNADCPNYNNSSIRLWRWRLMSKSYFHLGRLELALDLLEKQELLRSSEDRCGSSGWESSIPFAVTVRELLHHKNAGNEAYQSGRHSEAVEHYTAVVSNSIESRPFAAICFCNRAAANQALAQIADAIADCSIAIALDGSYSKALSRRATLHETIRDYKQAASDLQRLISLLKRQSQEKVRQSGTPDRPIDSTVKELTKAHRHLHSVEEKAKKGTSLDHYLILGIKASDTAAEIKKAYRKAALRHHPDKAGQFLARSDIRDDGKLWKEIADEVHKDSDRLFKMIGEAYAVLSDPTKRSEYDLQEEIRNAQKESNGSRASRGPSDFYSSPFRSNGNRRYWQESSKTYQNSRSQW
ncbi:heat shock protein DnaJ with tetratricopeptide repeat-containing protein [Actinidia rufa]|uniref:Heat shock protein DnaJ with tetratricopeptide repeat-containing protein n=1 Tax=Actinidia rufa TaxID=165716 RepID=A0A7J0DK42_9ERIC|nr:heat shock protein DnaJ with tetratricopeptide repeat-containing protein [Actinidia rufa]